jgi:hypothetical protein
LKDIDNIITQLEEQKAAIERAISALRDIGGSAPATVKKARRGRPPGRPPAAASAPAPAPAPLKKKRRLSPEGRKRIIEALKKRWAVKKAAARKAARKASKKTAASAA